MERRISACASEGASNGVVCYGAPGERSKKSNEGGADIDATNNNNKNKSKDGEQLIRWDRFLPRRFLRVLLVENDDSTRHVVSALLRKCNYQVAAVADGLKAWEFMKEKNFNFDLVLTEVVMPSLTGIGLLSKIMSSEICKNIPVIMMSSNDSIGIVFKCMLKGAADFLVKPVRKNELRNLWQHVWRKYCSSSGRNGSDNQIMFEAVSDNGAANVHAHQHVDNKSNARDHADRENDTQSTCSKPDTDTRHERAHSEPLQTEQEILSRENESKFEKCDSDPGVEAKMSSMHASEEEKGIEIQVRVSIQAARSDEKIQENNSVDIPPSRDGDALSLRCKHDPVVNSDSFCQTNVRRRSSKEVGFIGTTATGQCSYVISEDNSCRKDVSYEGVKTSHVNRDASNFRFSPSWELSLKGPQINDLDEKQFQERHILKQSDSSAFSRYGNTRHTSIPKSGSSPSNKCIKTKEVVVDYASTSGGDGPGSGKCIPFLSKETSSLATSMEKVDQFIPGPVKEHSYLGHSSTQEEVVFTHPLGVLPLPVSSIAIPFQSPGAGFGAMLQPVLYQEHSITMCNSALVHNRIEVLPPKQTVNCDGHQVDHFHFNQQHHRSHQLQWMKEQIVDEESLDPQLVLHATEKAKQSSSHSQSYQIGSGSNKSNEDTNVAMNRRILDSGNVDGFESNSGQGLDWDRARREAAITKFRLKRKDRCFEKKVRYYSRQKLAEQRPRVKGQFVRRSVLESTTTGTDTDD